MMKFWVLPLAAALLFSAGESVILHQKVRCDGNKLPPAVFFPTVTEILS